MQGSTTRLIVPSGKHTKNYGKSPFLMEKLTINGHKSPFLMGKLTINGHKSQFLMGKLTINGHKSPFLMGKLTISMAIFNSYVSHNQRVSSLHFAGADRAVVDACRQQVREWLEPRAQQRGKSSCWLTPASKWVITSYNL